jgi:hypothetical protein
MQGIYNRFKILFQIFLEISDRSNDKNGYNCGGLHSAGVLNRMLKHQTYDVTEISTGRAFDEEI